MLNVHKQTPQVSMIFDLGLIRTWANSIHLQIEPNSVAALNGFSMEMVQIWYYLGSV